MTETQRIPYFIILLMFPSGESVHFIFPVRNAADSYAYTLGHTCVQVCTLTLSSQVKFAFKLMQLFLQATLGCERAEADIRLKVSQMLHNCHVVIYNVFTDTDRQQLAVCLGF